MKRAATAIFMAALSITVSACGSGKSHDLVLRVPSPSMYPTYHAGVKIAVDTHAYKHAKPAIGDVIVLHPPASADNIADPACGDRSQGMGHAQACDRPVPGESKDIFIKRVVAGPGDRISIIHGLVIRDGKRESGSHIAPCHTGASLCTFASTITIPRGEYFVMGDNRGASDDSRFWGPIPRSAIIGKVTGTTNAKPSRKTGL